MSAPALSPIAQRFISFVTERFPLGVGQVAAAIGGVQPACDGTPDAVAAYGRRVCAVLSETPPSTDDDACEVTPRVTRGQRLQAAREELRSACEGFFEREAIAASLTRDERLEILRGMLLTRAVDSRLKRFFLGTEVRYRDVAFQGKGFRSLGQEAIYAAAIRLKRGERHHDAKRGWSGDVVGPIIRDAGVALAMRPDAATVRMILNAQMGKSGPPMDGKDLHIGDMAHGILPATAPLAISTITIAGLALAFALEGAERVAVSFIGDGGSSLGEWHEAINLCAARRLPAVFCVENNQIALSTPLGSQSAVRVFADKAAGYGIPGITIDGTDADAVAAAFAWAADRARRGDGPALIELVSMRMCGHAHHDDMLYLGRETRGGRGYAPLVDGGYADRSDYEFWSSRDPVARYAARLTALGMLTSADLERYAADAEELVEREAAAVTAAPWPDRRLAGENVVAADVRVRAEPLDASRAPARDSALPVVEPQMPFDPRGHSFLDAITLGIGDALRRDPRVFVLGEDVGAPYGNAFMLLRPLLDEFADRIVDTPLAESAILGASVGAALAGLRPIAEMQFNDFVASGFNQLVNNAAKIRYRWGASVPMVVRMPWGGLRHAGPYHSQNTEAWFYRTPGLKIVAPSTPQDARAMLAAAVADPDPVLFYEHIALYRDPRLRQRLDEAPPSDVPAGRAAVRRSGSDLAIVSYGAFVHLALRVADRLAGDGIEACVLDLRWLAPLDRDALLRVVRHCNRLLIVHEDTRTGGIGESLAAIVQEEAFDHLDAPIRIIGALDTPVPYSPPLEDAFLPSEEEVERAARKLVAY